MGQPAPPTTSSGIDALDSTGIRNHSGAFQDQDVGGMSSGFPARSVIAIAIATENVAGSEMEVGSLMVIVAVRLSLSSTALVPTGDPSIDSANDCVALEAKTTGSEKA